MDENQKDRMLSHVQSMALHTVVVHLLERAFASSPKGADAYSRDLLNLYELLAEKTTFPDVDPALSDLATQEFRDSLIRIVLRARYLALGEPFDPDAYLKDWRTKE